MTSLIDSPDVLAEIAAERARQIAKGWTPEHDDRHRDQSLAMAAACYAAPRLIGTGITYPTSPGGRTMLRHGGETLTPAWPWPEPQKRRRTSDRLDYDRRAELVIAAALIIAEIERIDRASPEGRMRAQGQRILAEREARPRKGRPVPPLPHERRQVEMPRGERRVSPDEATFWMMLYGEAADAMHELAGDDPSELSGEVFDRRLRAEKIAASLQAKVDAFEKARR